MGRGQETIECNTTDAPTHSLRWGRYFITKYCPEKQSIKVITKNKSNMNKQESSELLDKAAKICIENHYGQRDKMNCAYFQHPMRVAMRCETDDEKMVALLHDTIEDTEVTIDYLLDEGFPKYITDAILAVTRQPNESYEEFIKRAKKNGIGRMVKIHDLEDNLDTTRLNEVSPEMAVRFSKYLKALRYLKAED